MLKRVFNGSFIKVFFIAVLCFAGALSTAGEAKANTVSVPAIIAVSGWQTGKPFITGLTGENTEVLVYIDGVYSTAAFINREDGATDNFFYRSEARLSEGRHAIMLIARDKNSLVLSPPSTEIEFVVPPLPAPTMLWPDKNAVIGKAKPLITGLTVSGTFAGIYIDGVYNGKTEILNNESGTADFAYQPFLNLKKGWHTVWATAEDGAGGKSGISDILNFYVENPMVAPTLFNPVVNNSAVCGKPFIVGLAKNESAIKVFIDHKLNGQFKAGSHPSGTVDFSYLPFSVLTKGAHLLYATAIDNRGKESGWSNIIYFTVRQPAIAQAARDEQPDAAAEIKEAREAQNENEVAAISSETGAVEEISGEQAAVSDEKGGGGKADEEVKKLIEEEIANNKEESGLINEDREKQGRLNFSMIVFIIFILSAIAWVLWVNRELIKEKREQNKKTGDEKESDDKKDDSGQGGLFPIE